MHGLLLSGNVFPIVNYRLVGLGWFLFLAHRFPHLVPVSAAAQEAFLEKTHCFPSVQPFAFVHYELRFVGLFSFCFRFTFVSVFYFVSFNSSQNSGDEIGACWWQQPASRTGCGTKTLRDLVGYKIRARSSRVAGCHCTTFPPSVALSLLHASSLGHDSRIVYY
mmetsp:Transcript_20076/g.33146  ORF Transcript_20076/g.33146 Transcript_20076/m.33146 type:complete len:164 (+) Transcript_20076:345-836(+)